MNAVQAEIREQAAHVRDALAQNPASHCRGVGPLDELVLLALKLAETPEPTRGLLGLRRTAA